MISSCVLPPSPVHRRTSVNSKARWRLGWCSQSVRSSCNPAHILQCWTMHRRDLICRDGIHPVEQVTGGPANLPMNPFPLRHGQGASTTHDVAHMVSYGAYAWQSCHKFLLSFHRTTEQEIIKSSNHRGLLEARCSYMCIAARGD